MDGTAWSSLTVLLSKIDEKNVDFLYLPTYLPMLALW